MHTASMPEIACDISSLSYLMNESIEIIGTESLGVRGLCCLVKTGERRIVIDPGVALGYIRHGLLPHPIQVATGERVRQLIIETLSQATDVVFSHFHGDHIPLREANPYQLATLTRQHKPTRKHYQSWNNLEMKRLWYAE